MVGAIGLLTLTMINMLTLQFPLGFSTFQPFQPQITMVYWDALEIQQSQTMAKWLNYRYFQKKKFRQLCIHT